MLLRVLFLLSAAAAAGIRAFPAGNSPENDGDEARKILGSSVVTSVSVIMNTQNGTQIIDAVGKPVPKPPTGTYVASPINLLNPDRYEFFTFDDNGELIKRLMTLEEIHSIIANGDGEDINYNSGMYLPEKKVNDVVSNVQSVLKEQIASHKNVSDIRPILDTPDVSSTWSMILPAIFNNNADGVAPEKPPMAVTADTIFVEMITEKRPEGSTSLAPETTVKSTTTAAPIVTTMISATTAKVVSPTIQSTTGRVSSPTTQSTTTRVPSPTTQSTTTRITSSTTQSTTTRLPSPTTQSTTTARTIPPIPSTSTESTPDVITLSPIETQTVSSPADQDDIITVTIVSDTKFDTSTLHIGGASPIISFSTVEEEVPFTSSSGTESSPTTPEIRFTSTSVPATTEIRFTSTSAPTTADIRSSSTTSAPSTVEAKSSPTTPVPTTTEIRSSSTTSVPSTVEAKSSPTTSVPTTTEIRSSSTTSAPTTIEAKSSPTPAVLTTESEPVTSSSTTVEYSKTELPSSTTAEIKIQAYAPISEPIQVPIYSQQVVLDEGAEVTVSPSFGEKLTTTKANLVDEKVSEDTSAGTDVQFETEIIETSASNSLAQSTTPILLIIQENPIIEKLKNSSSDLLPMSEEAPVQSRPEDAASELLGTTTSNPIKGTDKPSTIKIIYLTEKTVANILSSTTSSSVTTPKSAPTIPEEVSTISKLIATTEKPNTVKIVPLTEKLITTISGLSASSSTEVPSTVFQKTPAENNGEKEDPIGVEATTEMEGAIYNKAVTESLNQLLLSSTNIYEINAQLAGVTLAVDPETFADDNRFETEATTEGITTENSLISSIQQLISQTVNDENIEEQIISLDSNQKVAEVLKDMDSKPMSGVQGEAATIGSMLVDKSADDDTEENGSSSTESDESLKLSEAVSSVLSQIYSHGIVTDPVTELVKIEAVSEVTDDVKEISKDQSKPDSPPVEENITAESSQTVITEINGNDSEIETLVSKDEEGVVGSYKDEDLIPKVEKNKTEDVAATVNPELLVVNAGGDGNQKISTSSVITDDVEKVINRVEIGDLKETDGDSELIRIDVIRPVFGEKIKNGTDLGRPSSGIQGEDVKAPAKTHEQESVKVDSESKINHQEVVEDDTEDGGTSSDRDQDGIEFGEEPLKFQNQDITESTKISSGVKDQEVVKGVSGSERTPPGIKDQQALKDGSVPAKAPSGIQDQDITESTKISSGVKDQEVVKGVSGSETTPPGIKDQQALKDGSIPAKAPSGIQDQEALKDESVSVIVPSAIGDQETSKDPSGLPKIQGQAVIKDETEVTIAPPGIQQDEPVTNKIDAPKPSPAVQDQDAASAKIPLRMQDQKLTTVGSETQDQKVTVEETTSSSVARSTLPIKISDQQGEKPVEIQPVKKIKIDDVAEGASTEVPPVWDVTSTTQGAFDSSVSIAPTNTIKEDVKNTSWTLVSTIVPHTNSASPAPEPRPVVSMDPIVSTPTSVKLSHQTLPGFGLEDTTSKLDTDIYQFVELCNELSFGFWNAVTHGISTARSVFASPFAATSLLAMVFLGARGATSGEMNEILRLDDMVTFNPHLIFKNVSESIEATKSSGVAVSVIARELYSDRGRGKLLNFYKERAKQFYEGHVEEINFREVGDIVRRRTNLIVRRNSGGKIAEYLKDNGITMRPPLAGISASIFQTDCSSGSTDGRDGELHFIVLPSIRQRRLVPVPAVVFRTGFLAGYDPTLDATAASIGTQEQIISTILVIPGQQGIAAPGDGLTRLERQLSESAFKKGAWTRLLRTLIPRPGLELQIPRFSHKSVINATVALQRMGLKDLFSYGKADLRGLNGAAHELHLSDILQLNNFATCGETPINSEQHHSEIYPATSRRPFRRTKKLGHYVSDSVFSDISDEPRDYQRAFHDPLHDPTLLSLPLPLRPRQARIPDAPRLRFDRPFLFYVRHNPTGLILHMGRFNPRLLP